MPAFDYQGLPQVCGAVNPVYEKIADGDIFRRRGETGGGAGLTVTQLDGQRAPQLITLGRP